MTDNFGEYSPHSPLTMVYSYLQRLQKQSQGLNPSPQESLAMKATCDLGYCSFACLWESTRTG